MASPVDETNQPPRFKTGLQDDCIGELFGKWASSSPWAQYQFPVAARVIGQSMHKEVCTAAVAQYARCLLTPEVMVAVLLNMRSPKIAFTVSLS